MKKIYLLFSIFILVGCQKDQDILEESPTIQNGPTYEVLDFESLPPTIKENFDGKGKLKLSGAKSAFPVNIDKKGINAYRSKAVDSYTFFVASDSLNKNKAQAFYFENLVITSPRKGKTKVYLFRYTPNKKWLERKNRDFENFKGKVEMKNIGNNEGFQEIYFSIDGKDGGSLQKMACRYYIEQVKYMCTGGDHGDYKGKPLPPGCIVTIVYRRECRGSHGGTPTEGNDGFHEPESIPTIPTGGGGGYNPPDEPENEEIMKIVRDPSFTEIDKINCTYNQLMKGTSLMDILTDFFGEDALFDVSFKVEEDLICNGKDNITGCTRKLNDDTYEILIDKDYILDKTTPTIFLAQTIIHEAIHANLLAAVIKLNYGIVPADKSFEALYAKYRFKKGWSHEFMADHYTGIMQAALKEVHPRLNDSAFLNGYDNNSLWDWDEFYEYMSYRGLQYTEKGSEYYQTNSEDINLYEDGAEANSTETPICN